jgi:hypothetical protein
MTGSRSKRLTAVDFDAAGDLAATDVTSMPVRAHRDGWAEGAAAHA